MSIVACLLYDQSKKLVFVPTASATAGAHTDHLFVDSLLNNQIYSALYFGVKLFPVTSNDGHMHAHLKS